MGEFRARLWLIRLIMAATVTFSAEAVLAQDYSSRLRDLPAQHAYQTLLQAQIFNIGGVGWGLEITREEQALRRLLASRNRIESFQRLLSEGNPEGQLYALYGLYRADPELFKQEVERLGREVGPQERWEGMEFIERGKIRTARGCIIFREERQKTIERMMNGEFDRAFRRSGDSKSRN